MRIPYKKDGKSGFINTGIIIENDIVNIRFKADGIELSTGIQGWSFISERVDLFLSEPYAVKLYLPNSAIMNRSDYGKLVLWPPNVYLMTTLIRIEDALAAGEK